MAITNLGTPKGYCTQDDIENYLQIDIDAALENQISAWIVAAEQEVDQYLGYTTTSGVLLEEIVNEVSESATVGTDNSLIINPLKQPIEELTALTLLKGSEQIDLQLQTGDGVDRYNILSGGRTVIYPERELTTTGSSLSIAGFRDIKHSRFFVKMSYRAGYNPVPGPISLATTMLASEHILRHQNKEGLQMLTQGRVTKQWFQRKGGESDLKKDAHALLDSYRNPTSWLIG